MRGRLAGGEDPEAGRARGGAGGESEPLLLALDSLHFRDLRTLDYVLDHEFVIELIASGLQPICARYKALL